MPSPDEPLQHLQPPHPRGAVQRRSAMAATPVGVVSGYKEDPDEVQVAVHHAEGRLTLHIRSVQH
ncbi:hypothetical protein EYF80_036897 [Liparis tanakae]|uniref:Uncharacterized protein n=1 Tax=Liparis tanakae TaxID=230148 RepID=A0A4Z2GJA8_9TELE|nr:hypothetical protein EYF80_036897 [Liparis tanakae]